MKEPFISLITPVYNIERLIGKTIESALEQTFTDWEMILVDDGSPDNAGKICDDYAARDKRIRVVHKQNAGLAAARNTGIEECHGKYFLIFEGSDLLVSKETLANICKTLAEREVDIYFARLQDMQEKGWEVTDVQKEYCVSGYFEEGGKALFLKLFENEDVLALSSPVNKVFRTAFVKENGLRFYPGIYHDDDEWLPRAISLSKISYFTNDIVYNALAWDGSFGGAVSDRSLCKKAVDKMFLALHCCEDMDARCPGERGTTFLRSYFEYYFRIYQSGVLALNVIKDPEYIEKVWVAALEHGKMFDYAGLCRSKKLRLFSLYKKIFGARAACKLILKRDGT